MDRRSRLPQMPFRLGQYRRGRWRGDNMWQSFRRMYSKGLLLSLLWVTVTMYVMSFLLEGARSHKGDPKGPDTVVFIALGQAARSYSLLYAVESLREVGMWTGSVHVVVDDEQALRCLPSSLTDTFSLVVANMTGTEREVGGGGTIVQAKLGKTHLLDLLPQHLRRVLYVDCDVITQRPLDDFWKSLNTVWEEEEMEIASAESSFRSTSSMFIFHDAAGHTIPFCAECDKAHSGVVGLTRGRSEKCLRLWREAFIATGAKTDQEALDSVLEEEDGCSVRWLNWRHMRFMKDIFVVGGMIGKRTFGHFTSLLHPERLSPVHRRHYNQALGRSFEEWGSNGGTISGCAP